jgi:hypothetical protein
MANLDAMAAQLQDPLLEGATVWTNNTGPVVVDNTAFGGEADPCQPCAVRVTTPPQTAAVRPDKEPGLVKRIAHRLHIGGHTSDSETELPPEEQHPKVQGYAGAVAAAVVDDILKKFGGEEGIYVLTKLVGIISTQLADEAVSEKAKKTTRINAQEAFTGSYDAVERKWKEFFKKLPTSALWLALVAGAYLVALAIALLLSLWRFAVFGLR